ncbi:hypothetical protein MUK42_10447 [Musa troglodytarum]|uniref:Uncharacterized protein n=1 Tax=Musa troglodytarum TaxID=320322 RepID=A0A9E7GPS5_9LILI|nr:hypothetical protein MUK42_10447 [Musa troglodytarum]
MEAHPNTFPLRSFLRHALADAHRCHREEEEKQKPIYSSFLRLLRPALHPL